MPLYISCTQENTVIIQIFEGIGQYCNKCPHKDADIIANSADPEQNAALGCGSTLFALPYLSENLYQRTPRFVYRSDFDDKKKNIIELLQCKISNFSNIKKYKKTSVFV